MRATGTFEFLEIYKKKLTTLQSPANDSSAKRRMVWFDSVFSNLRAEYKLMGLKTTSQTARALPVLLSRFNQLKSSTFIRQ